MKVEKIKFCLISLLAILLTGCGTVTTSSKDAFPDLESDIPKTIRLPIDGEWITERNVPIIIDCGRIYFKDSKRILAKNIISKNGKYSCDYVIINKATGVFLAYTSAKIYVDSSNKLTLDIPKSEIFPDGAKDSFSQVSVNKSSNTFDRFYVTIDPNPISKEASSEVVEVAPGAKVRVKKSRTIEHTIDVKLSEGLELTSEVEANLFALDIKGMIKKEIGSNHGQEVKQIETIEQEVELDGNVNSRFQLIWYDKILSGSAKFIYNSKTISIPFTYKEATELSVRSANSSSW